MTTATEITSKTRSATTKPPTLDKLVERLGSIRLSRILAQPAPGLATEADLIEAATAVWQPLRIGRRSPGGERHGIPRIAAGRLPGPNPS